LYDDSQLLDLVKLLITATSTQNPWCDCNHTNIFDEQHLEIAIKVGFRISSGNLSKIGIMEIFGSSQLILSSDLSKILSADCIIGMGKW